MNSTRTSTLAILASLVLLAAACGGGSSPSPLASTEPSAGPSSEPSAPTSAAPSASASAAAGSPAASPSGQPATFWVNPATLYLTDDGTTIKGFLNEKACASGQSPEGRVEDPVIEYGTQAVTVTIYVRPLPGNQDCQGNPDSPVVVKLAEPLDGRQILDGSANPPRDATTHPS